MATETMTVMERVQKILGFFDARDHAMVGYPDEAVNPINDGGDAMAIESAAVRVARGAALLDERRPEWWEKIDGNRLNMREPCGCVLGQLDGEYCEGVRLLAGFALGAVMERNKFGVYYGFDVPIGPDVVGDLDGYAGLQREWLRVIAERKAEAPTVVWTHREREPVR